MLEQLLHKAIGSTTTTNQTNSNHASSSEKGLAGVLDYTKKSSQSVAQFAEQNRVSSNHLRAFGSVHGENFSDITYHLGDLLCQWSNILMEFSHTIDHYRDTLKTIQRKEAALQPARDQKRKLIDQIDRIQSSLSSSSMEKQAHLRDQLERLQSFTQPDEEELVQFRKVATKEALYLLLNGMHTMASKTEIVSVFGKYIVDELKVDASSTAGSMESSKGTSEEDTEEHDHLQSKKKSKRIVDDALHALEAWKPDQTKLRRTLTSHHQGHNPLLAAANKQLPPVPTPSTSGSEDNELKEPHGEELTRLRGPFGLAEKQYTVYKPDDIPLPQPSSSTSTTNTTTADNSGSAVMNNKMYYSTDSDDFHLYTSPLKTPLINNQQHLYQFYQHYLPPRPYEDFVSNSPAVFHHQNHDVGGFVLPFTNPNFTSQQQHVQPQPSMSTRSTASSSTTAAA